MTRRALLSLLPAYLAAAEKKQGPKHGALPPQRGEFVRFTDAVTENIVVRLTNPAHGSFLPTSENRFVSSREAFLVFSSERTGSAMPYRANLRTGAVTPIGATKTLAARSLALDWRERELYVIDGGELKAIDLKRLRSRTIAEDIGDFHLAGPGNEIVIRRQQKLQLIAQKEKTVIADGAASRGIVSPIGTGCAFTRQETPGENQFWYVAFDGSKSVLLTKGRIWAPFWRPDAKALLFLRAVERERYTASELREVPLDGSPERLIAETSQFATFAPNGDGSVIVGASRSRAQPDLVLLLREERREMVLCEHHAKQPAAVSPAFSPNSQRVYFESDREGKSALYSVNVELLVEQTKDQE
jgi:oligogalacturonide lyase